MRPRILFLNRWPQHRDGRHWENELARPADLIDHERYHVIHLCDPAGRSAVPEDARDVYLVPDLTDVERVLAVVDAIIAEHGGFDHVIALSEYLLDLAATIRERHAVAGFRPADIDRFRDKRTMKTLVARAGIPVPRWFDCRSAERTLADAESLGYPLIIKPVRGASSQGVELVASAERLRARCAAAPLDGYEIEEYVPGDILHADGVVDQRGECLFVSVSRYLSTCLDFESGSPFGSVIQTDPTVCAGAEKFTLRCLAALGLRGSAFHLEFFDTGSDFVFLEIGARVPGADVSYVTNEVCGVNLFRLWTDVVLGHAPRVPRPEHTRSGAWLMIPRPLPLPRRVVGATSLLGRIPYLYRELVPRPGEILDHAGGYATLQGGRFLFRGGSQEQVTDAVHDAVRAYRLDTEPIVQ